MSGVSGRCAAALAVVLVAGAIVPVWASSANGWSYPLAQAVDKARNGAHATALAELDALWTAHPGVPRILHDYAVVAGWAERDQHVVDLLSAVPLSQLPTYVLEVYAKSQRNLKNWAEARLAYRSWLGRDPQSVRARIGLALTEADADAFSAAHAALSGIEPTELDKQTHALYALACGYVEERQRAPIRAIDCYNQGLRVSPDNQPLIERRALVASSLGASRFAARELERVDHVDPADTANVHLDATALKVRWLDLEEHVPRYAASTAAQQDFDGLQSLNTRQARSRDLDRFVAQVRGEEMSQANAAFERLVTGAGGLQMLPSYVLQAAGQMYLYLEKPEQAVEAYQAALANLGDEASDNARFDAQVGLFYALSDAGRFVEAYNLGAQISEAQDAWVRPTPKLWLENDRYVVAREVGALADAYTDRFDAALQRFEEMLGIAPAHDGLRLSSAVIQRWRGWTRRSQAELERVSTPGYEYPRGLLAGQLAIDRRDYRAAAEAADAAMLLHPRGKGTVDLNQRLARHRRSEVFVQAGFGRSDANQIGNDSFYVDGWYYTPLLADRYRGFVHSHYRQADFVEGRGRDHRLGVGAEYLAPYWSLSAEINHGFEQNDEPGAVITHRLQSSDTLSHQTSLSWNTLDVPLRGTRVGVTGDGLTHRTTYRWHEGAHVGLGVAYVDMNDGNDRRSASLSGAYRFLNWPRHKLSALGSVYTSRNSLDGAAYFNPRRDSDVRIGLQHEWLLRHDYSGRSVLRTNLWAGEYRQRGFASGSLWHASLEYAHTLNDLLEVVLGVSSGRRPYDGVKERIEEVYLSVRARP